MGGGGSLLQKELLNFLWQITSHGDNHCFASGGEQIIGGTEKQ